MQSQPRQYFQEVSENYQHIDVSSIQRRTSVLEVFPTTLTDAPTLKHLSHSTTILQDSRRDLDRVLDLIRYCQKWAVEEGYLLVFKKTLLIRLEQNAMTISYGADESEDVDPNAAEFRLPQGKTLNLTMLAMGLKVEKDYLLAFRKCLQNIYLALSESKNLTAKQLIIDAKTIHSKIYTITEMFPSVCTFPLDDLLNFRNTFCERWEILKDYIRFRCFGSEGVVLQSFAPLKEQVIWANAAMNRLHEGSNLDLPLPEEILRYFKKGFNIIQMLFMKDIAKKQAQKLISEPNESLTQKIWNLTDQGFTKNMLKVVFPTIVYSHKIFIPRLVNLLTLEKSEQLISELKENGINHAQPVTNKQDIAQKPQQSPDKIQDSPEVCEHAKFMKQKFSIDDYDIEVEHPNEYRQLLYSPSANRIPLRINSPFLLEANIPIEPTFLEKVTDLFKTKPNKFSTVILHIHGGGFIGMSSYSHQIYTRKWANQLKTPIFSVDYRKAPEFPYPQALDDCLEAYIWVLKVLEQVFVGKPTQVLVVGDSAGGNLAMALTALTIKLGIRTPDYLFLVYPALNLDEKGFTPSLLHALQDFILPHTYLKICAKAYLQKYKNPHDYLVSPILTPDTILKHFPYTRIYVGSNDPFSDDCYRLTEKLMNLNVNVRLTVYQSFGHGFLQFDNALMPIPEARQAVDEICADMAKAISKKI